MEPPHAAALHRYFASRPQLAVASAYLFGSHAKGRQHRESDLDVAVLLSWERYPEQRQRFDLRVELAADLPARMGVQEVDVVVLNDAPPMLGRHVVWHGQRVFVAQPETDHAYVRDVQIRAADLAPWLERVRRRRLEALLS